MNTIKVSKKSIIILIILTVGLVVTLVLVKKPTFFKSKAAADIDYPGALNITDASGQELAYKGEGVYAIKGDKIKLGIKDIDKLIPKSGFDVKKDVDKGLPGIESLPVTSEEYRQRFDDIATREDAPPLAPIPTGCQSIGLSKSFKIPKPLPLPQGPWPAITSISNGIFNAVSPIARIGLSMPGTGLAFKWNDSGDIPLSQGGDDPRLAIRVIRISASLGDGDYRSYWLGNLEQGCIKILERVEQLLLEGKWLPSFDELEEQARRAVG